MVKLRIVDTKPRRGGGGRTILLTGTAPTRIDALGGGRVGPAPVARRVTSHSRDSPARRSPIGQSMIQLSPMVTGTPHSDGTDTVTRVGVDTKPLMPPRPVTSVASDGPRFVIRQRTTCTKSGVSGGQSSERKVDTSVSTTWEARRSATGNCAVARGAAKARNNAIAIRMTFTWSGRVAPRTRTQGRPRRDPAQSGSSRPGRCSRGPGRSSGRSGL